MKGFVACAVVAMVAAARRPLDAAAAAGPVLRRGDRLRRRVRHLLRRLEKQLPAPHLCIVGEPTLMRHRHRSRGQGRPPGGLLRPGRPLGPGAQIFVNAIHMASDLVASVREVQRELSETGPREEGYGVPYSTVHVGVIQGGRALNIVPSECELSFEIRHVSEDQPEEILARVLKRLAERVAADAVHPEAPLPDIQLTNSYPSLSTPEDSRQSACSAACCPPAPAAPRSISAAKAACSSRAGAKPRC